MGSSRARAAMRSLGVVADKLRRGDLVRREGRIWPAWFRPREASPLQIGRVEQGLHPTGRELGGDARCRDCAHLVRAPQGFNRPKCDRDREAWTRHRDTDVRPRWASCVAFEPAWSVADLHLRLGELGLHARAAGRGSVGNLDVFAGEGWNDWRFCGSPQQVRAWLRTTYREGACPR